MWKCFQPGEGPSRGLQACSVLLCVYKNWWFICSSSYERTEEWRRPQVQKLCSCRKEVWTWRQESNISQSSSSLWPTLFSKLFNLFISLQIEKNILITVNGKLLMLDNSLLDNSIYRMNSNVCFMMNDVKKSFSKI